MNPMALFLLFFTTTIGMLSGSKSKDSSALEPLSGTHASGVDDTPANSAAPSQNTVVTIPEGHNAGGTPYEAPSLEPVEIVDDGVHQVVTGRVSVLKTSDNSITDVELTSGVEHGTVTVNPDNSFALVLSHSDYVGTQSFTYRATHEDGSVTEHEVSLDVTEGAQAGGWGSGASHYMLETDEDDRIVVEHGDIHTKVYVSGDPSALTIADIAALEGVPESQVTGEWLLENTTYGQNENESLAEDSGYLLWKELTPSGSDSSNWLLFERGYQYENMGRLLSPDVNGEGELHPLYIGAWGDGDKPEITTAFRQYQESSENVVIQDIHFSGKVTWIEGGNVIFDNITVTEQGLSLQSVDSVTIRNSDFFNIYLDESRNGGDWEPHLDRDSGIFANRVDGLLLENTFVDHAGWADGFDPNGSGLDGQPPSQYSQNIYFGDKITDVTMRDVITMRGASFGAQVRSGGFIEDNVFIDNNAAFTNLGGDYQDAGHVGQYTLMTDNVITSAAYKEALSIGAKAWGLIDRGALTSLLDNIVTHLADPNNPSELDYKLLTDVSLRSDDPYFDNTIVWNWEGASYNEAKSDVVYREYNADDVDPDLANLTTIQLFTAELLGKPDATIADLATYLQSQANALGGNVVDADDIIKFFQNGFGIETADRDEAATLRFIPNELGDGIRWDNRLNWDTDDLPGTRDGDSVDLAGNHVVYGGTTTLDHVDMGNGGRLDFHHGKLTVEKTIIADDAGADISIDGSGQLWAADYNGTGALDINVQGGRFVNTGDISNVDLAASDGQTILATDGAEFNLISGRTLAINSDDAKIGFDGDDGDLAILDIHEGGELSFSTASQEFGKIEEFRSGAMGDAPNVLSGVDLGDGTLLVDLTGLSADVGTEFELIESDEVVGTLKEVSFTGLGARDAEVIVDYLADTVSFKLTAGSGVASITTVGNQDDYESEALWNALTQDHGFFSETATVDEDDSDVLDFVA